MLISCLQLFVLIFANEVFKASVFPSKKTKKTSGIKLKSC